MCLNKLFNYCISVRIKSFNFQFLVNNLFDLEYFYPIEITAFYPIKSVLVWYNNFSSNLNQ